MDDKTQKERLEQELRFLKESFEAEVISREEFEKGKERIEKKLKEIDKITKEPYKEQNNELQEGKSKEEQNKEQTPEKVEKTESESTIEAKTGEKIKLKVIQDEAEEHEHFEPIPIKVDATKKIEEYAPETPKIEIREEKKESKFFKYSIVFVVLVLVMFFSYSFLKGSSLKSQEKISQVKFVSACSSNDDCKQEGKEGTCISPGTKDAKCEFKDVQKVNVIVLNDRKNCFNCNTQRVLSILEDWFGAINAKEIAYDTGEGRNLTEKFDIELLPAYILDENTTKKSRFEQFKQTFAKKDGDYILSEDASGSTFFFKRDSIPNKLDLFVILDDNASIKAEKNLREFLEAFKDVKFEKHLSTDKLSEELRIKNFPAFLVNNRVKFSGVQTAETIKNNFCKLNKDKACEKSLDKSLV